MKELLATLRWTARQHWWLPPLALAALLGVGWEGARLAKPGYVQWRTERAIRDARARLAANDLPRTEVALEVALRGRPGLATYQLVADYCEAIGSRQAIDARRLALELRPGDLTLQLDLARTALRFSELPTARATLEGVPEKLRGSAEYRRMDATAALLGGDLARARTELAALRAELPQDPGIRFLNDSLLVRSPDSAEAERARIDLRAVAEAPPQRAETERVLLADAVRRKDSFAAAAAGRALAAASGATYVDQLDAISAERMASPSRQGDPALVAQVRSRAAADPALAAKYGRRLLLEDGGTATAAWLAGLPEATARSPALAEVSAECAAAQGDWATLCRRVGEGAWGPVTAPVLDLAFGARALHAARDTALADRTWAAAVAASADSPISFRALIRLADIWQWQDGMETALLAEVHAFPEDQTALQRLVGLLHAQGRTRTLLTVLADRNAARPPSDGQIADWALLDVLVNPPAVADPATRALEKLRIKSPRDPFVATDWALALCDFGRPREAAAVLDGLTASERAAPARGPYLAFIYASAGRATDAQRALLRSPPAEQLLPEEAALLRKAATLAGP